MLRALGLPGLICGAGSTVFLLAGCCLHPLQGCIGLASLFRSSIRRTGLKFTRQRGHTIPHILPHGSKCFKQSRIPVVPRGRQRGHKGRAGFRHPCFGLPSLFKQPFRLFHRLTPGSLHDRLKLVTRCIRCGLRLLLILDRRRNTDLTDSFNLEFSGLRQNHVTLRAGRTVQQNTA